MENQARCRKFDTVRPSCRFYVFVKGKRHKVHTDGPVDFVAVSASFKDQGVKVSPDDLKKAYDG